MTVTLKHSSGDTVICHGTGNPGETGYYVGPIGDTDAADTEWTVEPRRRIGAAAARPLDLGNAIHTFALAVERRFASEGDARAHARTLHGGLPRGGTSLEVTDEEAGYKTVYASAVLQRLHTGRVGCSLDITFLFMTSAPVRTALEA